MINTYALILNPENNVHTVRIVNVEDNNQKVQVHNLMEWLDSTEFGRFEFAPDKCLWFAPVDDDINLLGMGLMGNRVIIRGNVIITTWTKRGPEAEGIPEAEVPEVWTWIEEIIQFNKDFMKDNGMTLEELRQYVEEGI